MRKYALLFVKRKMKKVKKKLLILKDTKKEERREFLNLQSLQKRNNK